MYLCSIVLRQKSETSFGITTDGGIITALMELTVGVVTSKTKQIRQAIYGP